MKRIAVFWLVALPLSDWAKTLEKSKYQEWKNRNS